MAEDPFEPTAVAGLQRQTPAVEFAATEMGAGMPPLQHKPAAQRNLSAAPGQDGDAASFSSSSLLAIESDDLMTDPELEEAAIRFANGDDVGAESALVDALGGEALVPEVAQAWVVALLDFYRATGQQQAFERVVIEHAARLDSLRPRFWATFSSGISPTVRATSRELPLRQICTATFEPGRLCATRRQTGHQRHPGTRRRVRSTPWASRWLRRPPRETRQTGYRPRGSWQAD